MKLFTALATIALALGYLAVFEWVGGALVRSAHRPINRAGYKFNHLRIL